MGRRVLPLVEGACSVNRRGCGGLSASPQETLTRGEGCRVVLWDWGGGRRRSGTKTEGTRAGWIGGLAKDWGQGLALVIAGGSHWILNENLG